MYRFIGMFPQLTYVDFRFYEILDRHRVFEPALMEGYPVLKVSLSLVLLVCSCGFNFATFAVMQEYLDRFEASAGCRVVVVCGCVDQCLAYAVKSPFPLDLIPQRISLSFVHSGTFLRVSSYGLHL